ncbi:MAG: DUF4157 domain-containing protein [Desulfovibrionales bacterium]|nr:DUF4157 domain-containing protein [Desulfovibrionales bacterium]
MKEKLNAQDRSFFSAATRQRPGPVAHRTQVGQRATPTKGKNTTGMPDGVKTGMESAFNADFSGVRVHSASPTAPEVGALAYTQGNDIHFAPGQFRPQTPGGRELLGHELAHVVQQSQGRVRPTTQIGEMAVNDDSGLETEADVLGRRAARSLD